MDYSPFNVLRLDIHIVRYRDIIHAGGGFCEHRAKELLIGDKMVMLFSLTLEIEGRLM
ncbi:MAG: hypothetical protein J7L90_04235 [Dehalococcoidia bacterium]|nr:hypothetical protein [Dehalococcoidia bacterium]